ncbi:MAG: oligosaccharide flippase family protein, partial [Polyangiaceae bacterium]|nr:oligosaccharide flippase family protein [Polyangiaceae bacterium]
PAEPQPAEPGETVDRDKLRQKVRWGVIALVTRTVVIQFVIFGGLIALSRMLDPRAFGLFAVVQFALTFFSFFGDAGLGGALIRKKEEPTERELGSVFVFHVGVSLAVFAVVELSADGLHYVLKNISGEVVWLLRVLAIDLVLTSLRVVPSVLMERRLEFGRLAVLDTVLTISYYGCAIALAALGMGAQALVFAAVCQGALGLVGAYVMRPWRPRLHFDWPLIKPMVKFGLAQQLRNVVALGNGAVIPVYGAAMLGDEAVGLITWAQGTAYFPLKLVEIMSRVTFPLYSRLQSDRALLGETLGRSVQICATVAFVWVALCLGLGPALTEHVYGAKWLPGVPMLYVFAGAITIGFMAPLIASALDAIGQPGVVARLAIGWTGLNWAVVLVTTPLWGVLGFTGGYAVHVVVGNALIIWVVARLIPGVRVGRRVWAAGAGALAVGIVGVTVLGPWAVGPVRFALALGGSIVLYAAVLFALDFRGLRDALSIVPRDEPAPAPAPARAPDA